MSTTEADRIAFAHRALAAATAAGLAPPARGALRVHVGTLSPGGGAPAEVELAVVLDDPSVADEALSAALASVPRAPALALIASSPATFALANDARRWPPAPPDDAAPFARVRAWAAARRSVPVAPPASAARLARIAAAAAAAGLALVEPELAVTAPALARAQAALGRAPLDRAVLALVALGATARPVLFARADRAPRGGVPKIRAGELRARAACLDARALAAEDALVAAALRHLEAERPSVVTVKELLRAARAARGAASSDDGPRLGAALYRLAQIDAIELFAVDPDAPGWSLTLG